MGKLLSEITASTARRGTKSRLLEIIEDMDKSDRADLVAALDNHSIPASSIVKALQKRGYKIDNSMISRYRRGELATDIHGAI